jgi:hypothetical protein
MPVQAPADVIWSIVRDCAEMPQRHRPEVASVTIRERYSDGLLRRVHGAEDGWDEKVTINDAKQTVWVELAGHEPYEGRVVYEVLTPGPESTQPTPRLGIRLYWKARPNEDDESSASAFSEKVRAELVSIKHAAELRAAQMAG